VDFLEVVSSIGYNKTRKQVKAVIEKQLVIRVFCEKRLSILDLILTNCDDRITKVLCSFLLRYFSLPLQSSVIPSEW